MKILESIVVEGRDDLLNLSRCLEADIIITSGYGLNSRIYKRLDQAYKRHNLIIFTDPDHVGEKIRDRLSKRYPKAKHAFLSREDATKKGDIGIENASCESLIRALKKVHCISSSKGIFTKKDLMLCDLIGTPGSINRRDTLGGILGIGYGNSKQFLKRLNLFGITREEFAKALEDIDGN